MDAISVTLIVKAPNQQIEDQTIKCELSWTIHKLKQHLSEVYPSKPQKHEQKLIYSGQLLTDTIVLKDILRQYEGQETHTVHLVCATPKSNAPFKPKPIQTPSPATRPAEQPTATNANTHPQPQSTTTTSTNSNAPQIAEMPQFNPMDANQYAMHMAWMQHAYMQYMTQYMNFSASGAAPNGNLPGFMRPETATPNPNQQQNGAEEAPEVPPVAPQRDPGENPDRDWLDFFYTAIRVVLLLSIVYVYSSPLRFLMVVCLGMAVYFYQLGIFPNFNNNNINNQNNNNMEEQDVGREVITPSVLHVVLSFFTSFFCSLVPDIPQAI